MGRVRCLPIAVWLFSGYEFVMVGFEFGAEGLTFAEESWQRRGGFCLLQLGWIIKMGF